MNDARLHSELKSAGIEWFAEFFLKLSDWSLSNKELIELLVQEKCYTLDSSRTKVYAGRRIIKAGRGKDALISITSSKNERAAVFAQALLIHGVEN